MKSIHLLMISNLASLLSSLSLASLESMLCWYANYKATRLQRGTMRGGLWVSEGKRNGKGG